MRTARGSIRTPPIVLSPRDRARTLDLLRDKSRPFPPSQATRIEIRSIGRRPRDSAVTSPCNTQTQRVALTSLEGALKRLAAGGSRMRTFDRSRDLCLSKLVYPCAETIWPARGEFLLGGTDGSNPVPSSKQSVSREISPSCIEKPAVAAGARAPAMRSRSTPPVHMRGWDALKICLPIRSSSKRPSQRSDRRRC